MSNRRSIAYLLALLLATVGANVWLDMTGSYRGGMVRRQTLVGSADAAVALEIRPRDRHSFRLEKTDRWRIVMPFRAVADQSAVDRLTDALAFDPLVDSVDAADAAKLGRTTADFGLDDPRIVLKISSPREDVVVSLGDTLPTGEGVYAAVAGSSAVYIASTGVFAVADLPIDSWRRRTVFRVKPDEVTAIDIRRGDSSVQLALNGERWEVKEPRRAMASSAAVKRIIDTVLSCEARRFVWPVGASNETTTASVALLAGYGLDPETCETVVFRTADGRDHSISFGGAADPGTVYALVHGGNAVATVTADARASVSLDASTLIDGRIFPIDRPAVQRISLVDGEDAYLLAREDGGRWRLDSPVSAWADETAVAALIDKLLVMRNIDLDESGIKVSFATNAQPVSVSRAALLGDGGFEQLRSKSILDIDAATVKRLVFSRDDGEKPQSVVFDPDRKGWNVDAAGHAGVIDPVRLSAVFAALSPLTAKSVERLKVAPGELFRYGLENPSYTIAIDRLIEGAVRRNLQIGRPVNESGDTYATVGSSDAVFVIDGAVVKTLTSGVFAE